MTHNQTSPTNEQELDEILVDLAYQIAANRQRLLNGNATREETIDSDSNATMRAEEAIQALITAEIAKAKLEAFDVAFDCHDYDRLRAYRDELLKEVK